ncbi:hypothetical protein CFAEC_13830 (plasmid) [Corynebacterium faecale]|uniref:Yag1A n=1 Tax=Corynebacterium glutamicum TaxID=1718 RepID=Q9X536_CORGT|nr:MULTISPECIES: hypothetical protein [Corynebacterium]AAD25055.1 Yag1A [Corynebacterium glutamicum]WJY93551.1 hypothetical protein CFAEC_13830 [Corynebacterium faecale]
MSDKKKLPMAWPHMVVSLLCAGVAAGAIVALWLGRMERGETFAVMVYCFIISGIEFWAFNKIADRRQAEIADRLYRDDESMP